MRFIKENPALAAGIGLPFLLVIFFTLASVITEWMVAPPTSDAFFTLQDSRCTNGDVKLNFSVTEGKIKVRYVYPKKENGFVNCYDNQRLYRFSAKAMSSKEVTLPIPAKKENMTELKEFETADLQTILINNNDISPDGYRFEMRGGNYRGVMFPFGGSYDYRDSAMLIKNGRVVNISPLDNNNYYAMNNIIFLGWVAAEGEKK